MLVIGIILLPLFVFVEWKIAKLPLMPSKYMSSKYPKTAQ